MLYRISLLIDIDIGRLGVHAHDAGAWVRCGDHVFIGLLEDKVTPLKTP